MAEELPHNISDREIRDAFNEKLEHIAAKDPNPYNCLLYTSRCV